MHLPMSSRHVAPLLHGAYRALRRGVPRTLEDPWGVLPRAAAKEPFLFVCRHGQLLPLLWAMEDYDLTVVVSRSHDGELLARILARRGFSLVRGSTTEEGLAAGRAALRALRQGARIGAAVDGPRGPRGMVQDGVLRMARAAGVPIVPLRAATTSVWIAPGSWDRFEIPLPGRPVRILVGAPVLVGPGPAGLAGAGEGIAEALGGWRSDPSVPPAGSPDPLRPSPSPS
jgi:lysophospholipid acyltransferase (LPLAT)-like uncharacterized protein